MKKTQTISANQPAMPVLDFLAHCSRTASLYGDWISAKDAKARNIEPSADIAYAAAAGGANVTADDWQTAAKAVEMFEARVSSDRSTQFDRDLLGALTTSNRTVHSKNYRMVAAIMGVYQRSFKQAAIVASQLPSFYLGAVGERLVIAAKVTHISAYQGAYSSKIINFVTVDGARLTWFCNSDTWQVGTSYLFKATIKAHREYRGQPQTVVNRCALVEVEVAA